MDPLVRHLLDAVYSIGCLLALPWLWSKVRSSGWQRFWGPSRRDLVPPAARCPDAALPSAPFLFPHGGCRQLPPTRRPRVWFHGVSLGEIHVLHRLIPEFLRQCPHAEPFVSATTDAGLAEARRLFPDAGVFRFPLDFSWAIEHTLRSVRPDLIVLAESEWWPNLLLTSRQFRIPVVAVNVRLSPKTRRRYRRFATLSQRWLNGISEFMVQMEDDAALLRDLGIDPRRIRVTGSMKYDGNPGRRDDPQVGDRRRLFGITPREVVWVCGSTQPEEERIALDLYPELARDFPELRLILVPRHPERFDEVARDIEHRGLPYVRRSRLSDAAVEAARPSIILVDTVGELRWIWGLADIAFVGGSLDGRRGGQNMIEPASFGAAVMFGPHTWNFQETVRQLLHHQAALEVADAAGVRHALRELLSCPDRRRQLGEAARRIVQSQQGATRLTAERLVARLDLGREIVGRAA